MPSILVVEDEPVVAKDIQRTLVRLGYEVVAVVATAADAMTKASLHRPDLALMDIRIKGPIDGIDAAASLRRTLGLPIIFLTAQADDATLARATVTEPMGYIVKPFHDRDLKSAVEMALYRGRMEGELRRREHLLATTLRSIADGVITTDAEGRVLTVNGTAEAIIGRSASRLVGLTVDEIFRLGESPSGTPFETPIREALLTRRPANLAAPAVLHVNGQRRLLDESAAPILDEQGRVLGGVIVFRDVTEQRSMEERLALTDRLASIGTLAAGLAHEINNPLTFVTSNVDFVLRTLEDAISPSSGVPPAVATKLREAVEACRDVQEGSARIRDLTRDLVAFARPQKAETELVDLRLLLDAAIKLTANRTRTRAEVRKRYGPVPFVSGTQAGLGQVFLNLLLNAADAIPEGAVERNEIVVATSTDERGDALVEVRDSGSGIPEEARRWLFDPFFTTKPVGRGTGLGLFICKGTVTSLGGDIEVESREGRGSVFRVRLPAAPSAPAAAALRGVS